MSLTRLFVIFNVRLTVYCFRFAQNGRRFDDRITVSALRVAFDW